MIYATASVHRDSRQSAVIDALFELNTNSKQLILNETSPSVMDVREVKLYIQTGIVFSPLYMKAFV